MPALSRPDANPCSDSFTGCDRKNSRLPRPALPCSPNFVGCARIHGSSRSVLNPPENAATSKQQPSSKNPRPVKPKHRPPSHLLRMVRITCACLDRCYVNPSRRRCPACRNPPVQRVGILPSSVLNPPPVQNSLESPGLVYIIGHTAT